jgi:hypothetical protein
MLKKIMPLLRGEQLNIGIGIEDPLARGVFTGPDAFIPGRSPSGITVEVVKTLLKETRASGVASRGSVVVARKASGNLEFNLRSQTIGYLLKSLFGKINSQAVAGSASAKDHTFTIEKYNPQFPTLSIALAAGNEQHYGYRNAMVKSLELKTPVDDLVNATVEFLASDEAAQSDFVLAFADEDYIFRPQDVQIKIAADVAGLAAAPAIGVKEFSYKQDNNTKPQVNIGDITPKDQLAGITDITGSLTIDYENTVYHDIYKGGTYKAFQITITRSDIALDAQNNHPTLTLTLPRVTFEKYSPDRPLDDIVRDKFDFTVHFDETADEAVVAVLRNNIPSYVYTPYGSSS